MSIKTIADKSGNTLKVLEYEGRLLPAFDLKKIAGVADFKAKSDDVIVCAYPKSGTHWIWEIVRLLLAQRTDLPVVEKDVAMIEDVYAEDLEKQESPRPLNTHFRFDFLPKSFFSSKCKLIYVTRDPRDVAVSFFHHHRKLVQYYDYKGNFHDYLDLFMSGQVDYESWFDYTKKWEAGISQNPDNPVFVTSYEEMHRETSAQVKKMAEFLGVSCDDSFLEKVIEKCSFDHMKSTKGKNENFEGQNGKASPIMYRKGKVGDWKNHFTVAEFEKFDEKFEKEMTGTKAWELYSSTNQAS